MPKLLVDLSANERPCSSAHGLDAKSFGNSRDSDERAPMKTPENRQRIGARNSKSVSGPQLHHYPFRGDRAIGRTRLAGEKLASRWPDRRCAAYALHWTGAAEYLCRMQDSVPASLARRHRRRLAANSRGASRCRRSACSMGGRATTPWRRGSCRSIQCRPRPSIGCSQHQVRADARDAALVLAAAPPRAPPRGRRPRLLGVLLLVSPRAAARHHRREAARQAGHPELSQRRSAGSSPPVGHRPPGDAACGSI